MSPRSLLRVLLAASCLTIAGHALAQDERPPDDPGEPPASGTSEPAEGIVEYVEVNTTDLPTSNTIATKLPVPLHETPANVGVVTEALMREQRARVLTDALINVSGVHVAAGNGVHDWFVVRGFDSLSSGLVLTDGAAEPEVTTYPTYNVEGIEVLKGPAGFLYGRDPLAGVVNLVRKQPLPADFGRFSLFAGRHDTLEGRIDWNRASDDGRRAFRLNAFGFDTEGFRDAGEGRQLGVNPSFAWRTGGGATLDLNLEAVEAELAPDAGLPLVGGDLPDVPRERSYATPFDFSDQDVLRFQADWERPLGERVLLRNKTYYRSLDWNTAGTRFNGVFPGPGGSLFVSRTVLTLDDEQTWAGNQLEAELSARTGGITHRILAGVEVARLDDDFAIGLGLPEGATPPGVPGIQAIDLLDPMETASVLVPLPFLAGEARSDVVAPYVMDQVSFGERVQLFAGLRWDEIDTEVDFSANAQEPGVAGFERDDGELSPMGGIVFTPRESLTLYANAGKSFAPAGFRVVGAAGLEPEESRQVELGAKQRWADGRIRATVAVYDIERTNIALTDDGGITQRPGDQSSRGFEVELAAEPRPGYHALVAYAYNDSELESFVELDPFGFPADRSGNDPPFAPRHLFRGWVGRSFDSGFGIAGGARYVGEHFVDTDNLYEIDDVLLLDATASWAWADCRLRLHLRNLTDEEYETRGFGSTSVIPAEPFSAQVGFEYDF